MGDAALVSSWMSRMFSLPITVLIMGQDALGNRYWPIFRNSRALLVTPSAFAQKTLLERVGRESFLIPFGLPSRILSVSRPLVRSIHLLSVGSVTEVKQPMKVLDLVLPVLARNPDWQAAWVGAWVDENLLSACLSRVVEAGLADRYRFLGELPRHEVWAVMADARALVHMARHEAQGMVIRESLALGCTVVTNGVGDVPDHPGMKVLYEGGADDSVSLEQVVQTWASLGENHPWPMSENWMKYEILWEKEGRKLP
jgi:glycosyltransferase involved in cell wall biosynthesis